MSTASARAPIVPGADAPYLQGADAPFLNVPSFRREEGEAPAAARPAPPWSPFLSVYESSNGEITTRPTSRSARSTRRS